MKISDLLRKLANQMDDKEKPVPLSMANGTASGTDADTATDDTATMVPPLQQQLELMKKDSGLDNAFDGESDTAEKPDELDQLKKMAGISQFAVRTVGDQNKNK